MILSQVHPPPISISVTSILILDSHCLLGLPSGRRVPTNIPYLSTLPTSLTFRSLFDFTIQTIGILVDCMHPRIPCYVILGAPPRVSRSTHNIQYWKRLFPVMYELKFYVLFIWTSDFNGIKKIHVSRSFSKEAFFMTMVTETIVGGSTYRQN
jgi:hypothetical protein